jgi:DNA invertase Pin-like site-specific DNA recombinase
MFDAIPDPFPSDDKGRGTNIPPSKIREIKQLAAEGKKKSEIAKAVGVHRTTIYRHVN